MIVSHVPPMMAVSIGKTRYSLEVFRHAGQFVIAFPSERQKDEAMLFGTQSGRDVDKFAAAGTALVLNLAPNPFAALEIAFWLLGSLEDRSMRHVLIALPFMIFSAALLMRDQNAFRALTLGEETAESLGFSLTGVRLRVIAGVAAGVGAGVAVAGSIGFIGLVAPHLVRPFVRYDPGRLMVPAALCGAALLLAADIAVRLIPSTSEIKVGVLTGLIGAPFFIALIFRRRRELAGLPA